VSGKGVKLENIGVHLWNPDFSSWVCIYWH